MENLPVKRITLFLGHYGSGKTNVAVNYAMYLKDKGYKTAIYDLDVVNPYFRTLDGKAMLEEKGVRLVASTFANSNVEVPSIPADNYAIIDRLDEHAVVDVGGDDTGALALGRYSQKIQEENDYQALLVINKFRFLTKEPKDVLEYLIDIEKASSLKITGLVNNSNLGEETTEEDILSSIEYAKEVEKLTGLKVQFTAIKNVIAKNLKDKFNEILPLEMIKYGEWE